MNAAVSFTMCVFGRLRWKMLPLYVLAQFLGSFLAAGTIFSLYYGEQILIFFFRSYFCSWSVGVGHINCHKVSLLTSVLCFIDAIHHYCGGNFTVSGPKATAGIFATYPAPYISIYTGFFDQVFQNEQCAKKWLDCTH